MLTRLSGLSDLVLQNKSEYGFRKTNYTCHCLVLFFSEQEDISKRALSAGLDKVVVKSPDAGEIVEMVSKYLA